MVDTLEPEVPRPGGGRLKSLAQLGGLAAEIAAARDLASIYRALLDFARAVTPATHLLVATYDATRQTRVAEYVGGSQGEEDVAHLPPMPMNDSPQSRAVQLRKPVVTPDLVKANAGLPVVALGRDMDPRQPLSSVAVPMIVRGQTIGVFELQSPRLDAFDAEAVEMIEMAASIAGIATDNLRRPARTRQRSALQEDRRKIAEVLEAAAFEPHFQPIVDLDAGRVVGHETLTRFSDGSPPGPVFAAAAAAGIGAELEQATLKAALAAAAALPPETWLSVNVSPHLIVTRRPLAALLAMATRPIVLEVTEHDAIGDYRLFRRSLAELPGNVRLAVDDAGAGYSSLRHILELHPDLVKLDLYLVRGIDTDLGRQALVAGMRHFADATGCGIVAEGVETEAELATLRSLGVHIAQGYLLARPGPITALPQTRTR